MTRGGKQKERGDPERRCIATGETGGKAGLIRFVVGPGDEVVPDLLEKLPGRGIWVSADAAALDRAATKNLFSRAAKRSVTADPGLTDRVEAMLRQRVIDLVSLARKAGEAVSGLEKVKEKLASGDAACIMQASDGSAREKARLRPPEGEENRIEVLSAEELGMAFGRDRVIHAALIAGGLERLVRYESARLKGLQRQKG